MSDNVDRNRLLVGTSVVRLVCSVGLVPLVSTKECCVYLTGCNILFM